MQWRNQAFRDHQRKLDEAILIVRQGGVVAYPTESFYGLGADPFNESALERIFQIKGREATKPILLLIGSREKVYELANDVPQEATFLMENFWPGPLTIVFEASSSIGPLIHCGTNKVGLRISPHPVALALAKALGAITGTSCNLSGQEGLTTSKQVREILGHKIDLILDWEIPCMGVPSTVVDITKGHLKVLRKGQISEQELIKALKKKFDIPSQI